jgi:hypothetical protein
LSTQSPSSRPRRSPRALRAPTHRTSRNLGGTTTHRLPEPCACRLPSGQHRTPVHAERQLCISLRGGALASRSPLVLPQVAEPCPHLACEEFGLFPGGEVAASVDLVEVDEVGVGLLGPAARGSVLLARKDAHGNGDGDALHVEAAALPSTPRQFRTGEPLARPVADCPRREIDAVTAVVAVALSAEPTGSVAGMPGRRCRMALSRSGNSSNSCRRMPGP